jgi:Pathogenicity locus
MPPVARSTVPAAALKDFQHIPGIGPSLAADLVDLGIRRVADLRRRSPERLYDQLIALRGVHQDPCVLYTFRCAVYFATEPNPEPEKLKWWNWKDAKPTPQKRSR